MQNTEEKDKKSENKALIISGIFIVLVLTLFTHVMLKSLGENARDKYIQENHSQLTWEELK